MARGSKRLAATITLLLAWMPAVASGQQPIEPLGGQLRLTEQPGDTDAQAADIAYNSVRNEFLAVWENRTVGDAEIFGRRLAADGTPIGAAFQISGLTDAAGFDARDPAVAFDHERNRYGVAYSRDDSIDGEREIFLQVVTGTGALTSFDGVPGPAPVKPSNIGNNDLATHVAARPDVVYRPDIDGDAATPDAFVVTYDGDETDNENNIFLAGVDVTDGSIFTGNDRDVSAMTATGDGMDPAIAAVPGTEDVVVAWEGFLAAPFDTEVFARRVVSPFPDVGSQTPITQTGIAAEGNAFDPAIAAGGAQFAVAYRADEVDNNFEVHLQRLDAGLGQIGTDDQQISTAEVDNPALQAIVGFPAIAFHSTLNRFLVTWIAQDIGRPGLSDDEREVMGSVIDANGAVSEPKEFTISRVGTDVDEDFAPTDTSSAANTATGRWLSIWSADGPPAADNEFEVFGRQVGENFDRDGDGALVPADCNDANPGIRPGANDVFDNGVDEDCAGGDAQNPDRDGDGSPRPADCDDANPRIRPGIPDVANNGIDEDCDGRKRRTVVDVKVERFFAVFRDFTRVTRLRVSKLRPGMRVQIRCSGKGCPKALRNGKVRKVSVKKSGRKDFTKLFKGAKLKPRAVLEVRVLQTGAIGRVDRFRIRDGKVPKRVLRCLPPGVKKPRACP